MKRKRNLDYRSAMRIKIVPNGSGDGLGNAGDPGELFDIEASLISATREK